MSAAGEKVATPCPITRRPYFMHIEHPVLGDVPTYGGPFDSYTVPEPDDDGNFHSEHYCHDRGDWIEGGNPEGLVLVTEREYNALLTQRDALEAREKVLREALRDASHRVRWVMQSMVRYDRSEIEAECEKWDALATGAAK